MKKLLIIVCLSPLAGFAQNVIVTNGQSYVAFDAPLIVSNEMETVLIQNIESPNPADTDAVYKIRIVKDFDTEQRAADGSTLQLQTSLSAELNVGITERIDYINANVPGANITAENYDQTMTVEFIRQSVVGVAVAKFMQLFAATQ